MKMLKIFYGENTNSEYRFIQKIPQKLVPY
jgi:hypothetical protein